MKKPNLLLEPETNEKQGTSATHQKTVKLGFVTKGSGIQTQCMLVVPPAWV